MPTTPDEPTPIAVLVAHRPGHAALPRVPVGPEGVVVGRAERCSLRLRDINVSKRHCRVWADGDALFVQDAGSTSGTFVKERGSNRTTRLQLGDVIVVCDWRIRVTDGRLWRKLDDALCASRWSEALRAARALRADGDWPEEPGLRAIWQALGERFGRSRVRGASWEVRSADDVIPHTFAGARDDVLALEPDPAGGVVVSLRSASHWQLASRIGPEAKPIAAAASWDAQRVVLATAAGRIVTWDVGDAAIVAEQDAWGAPPRALALSAYGDFLACAGGTERAQPLAETTRVSVDLRDREYWGGIAAPDGYWTDGLQRVADPLFSVRIWDLRTRREVATLEGPTAPVVSLDLSDDGGRALAVTALGEAFVWDVGRREQTYGQPSGCLPRGRLRCDGRVALLAQTDAFRLVDLSTGEQRRFPGRTAYTAIDATPDLAVVATGDAHGRLSIWSTLGQSETWHTDVRGAPVRRVVLAPDASSVVVVDGSNVARTLRLDWDVSPAPNANPVAPPLPLVDAFLQAHAPGSLDDAIPRHGTHAAVERVEALLRRLRLAGHGGAEQAVRQRLRHA